MGAFGFDATQKSLLSIDRWWVQWFDPNATLVVIIVIGPVLEWQDKLGISPGHVIQIYSICVVRDAFEPMKKAPALSFRKTHGAFMKLAGNECLLWWKIAGWHIVKAVIAVSHQPVDD